MSRARRSARFGLRRISLNRSAVRLVVVFLALVLLGWGAGQIARVWAQPLDLRAVRGLASDRTSVLTTMSHVLSLIGSGYVVFPLSIALSVTLVAGGRRRRALLLLVGTFGAVALANADKLLVARPRPPAHHLEHVSSWSFPSGHTTQSAAFYVALLLVFIGASPPRSLAAVVLAGILLLLLGIAFARVCLGVHYPTDVAAGLILGGLWALMANRELRC